MIQDDINSTIKRVYDQYNPQDFSYGSIGSDNLNPQRDMVLDKIDKVEKKIQEITNAIVIKKLKPKDPEPEIDVSSVLPESSSGNNFQKQVKIVKTGTVGDNIFDLPDILTKQIEEVIGIIPTDIGALDKPLSLQCTEVLKQYTFTEKNYVVFEEDDILPTYIHNDEDEQKKEKEDEDNNDKSDKDQEDDDKNLYEDCAEIELEFLKILLVILRILKVIRIILDFIITLITTIIQIICLAVGAWLNPPNIAQIIQIIIEIIIALIILILSKLLQLIWNMLNFDCLADQTLDTIDQIRSALSAFRNILGFLNPSAVQIIGDKFKLAFDPLDQLKNVLKNKNDAWRKMISDLGQQFSDEGLEQLKDELDQKAEEAAIKVIKESEANKVDDIYTKVVEVVAESRQTAMEGFEAGKQIYETLRKQSTKSANNREIKKGRDMLQSPCIQNVAME